METNLPELCRRVWGKVPEARPTTFGKCYDGPWTSASSGVFYGDDEAASMIQAAALRWLLANNGMGFTAHYGNGNGRYFFASEDTYPDRSCVWHATDKDLTTCLLLAVERCQEYKENSK
jgi:hypothetical protein